MPYRPGALYISTRTSTTPYTPLTSSTYPLKTTNLPALQIPS